MIMLELGRPTRKKPHAIANNRPTQAKFRQIICSLVLARLDVFRYVHESRRNGRRATRPEIAQERRWFGLQSTGKELDAKLAVPVVGSTFGHNIHHAAGGAAEFGLEAGTLNLAFLDNAERQIVVRPENAGAEVSY